MKISISCVEDSGKIYVMLMQISISCVEDFGEGLASEQNCTLSRVFPFEILKQVQDDLRGRYGLISG